jgi:hypothetical protein
VSGTLTYNDTDFRTQLPFFANTSTYPQANLQEFFNLATEYVSAQTSPLFAVAGQQSALYLMTAHLQALYTAIVANLGAAPGVTVNATIDKIKVQIQPPPSKTAFTYWLNQSPWGQQLLALLSVNSVGGYSMGGRPGLGAFRNAWGGFG